MAQEVKNITETKEGADKAFKGSGVEGTKGSDVAAAEKEKADAAEKDAAEKDAAEKEAAEKEAAEKKAAEEAAVAKKAECVEMKKRLKVMEAEHKKKVAKEDKSPHMDGTIMTERKHRLKAIECLKGQIKG